MRLFSVYSSPQGYPRLCSYLQTALHDHVLLRYPLLHADVLIFQLDASYGTGSSKYSNFSSDADWNKTLSRLPGEDIASLAVRVTNAFLTMYELSGLTEDGIYESLTHRRAIHQRFYECLLNDPTDPDRGTNASLTFFQFRGEEEAELERGSGKTTVADLNIFKILASRKV